MENDVHDCYLMPVFTSFDHIHTTPSFEYYVNNDGLTVTYFIGKY